jgi:hypothetical protein
MKLTHENLHAASSSGYDGFTKAQLLELGISWPPKKGWLSSLIGREISDESYDRFCAAGKIKAGELRRLQKEKSAKPDELTRLRNFARYVRDHSRAGLESGGNIYLQLNLINSAAIEVVGKRE